MKIIFFILCVALCPTIQPQATTHPSHSQSNVQIHKTNRLWALGNHDQAYKQAQQILASNTLHTNALIISGRYAALQMLKLREKGYTPEEEQFVHWQQLAVGYLVQALNTNPDHRPARLLLSQVYYEAEMSERLIGLYEHQRRKNPQDPEPYFMMSLGLQDLGKTRASYQAFLVGIQNLKDGYFTQSLSIIDPTNQDNPLYNLSKRWQSRDPLFLTGVNERLKTHFCRVAYAEIRFGDASNNLHGYQTDMGEMYVRYGDPKTRTSRTGKRGLEEVWIYPDFKLVFQKDKGRWHCAWVETKDQQHHTPLTFKTKKPDLYKDPYQHLKYPIHVQVGQFRAPNGQTRLELYFGLPEDEIEFDMLKKGLAQVNIQKGIFAFGADGQTVSKSINHLTHMPHLSGKTDDTNLLLWTEQCHLEPGKLTLAIEAQDQKNASVGYFVNPVTVSDFRADTLQVSTPLLAHRIQAHHTRPYGREHFTILANPSGQFDTHANIATYFETYNLKPDQTGHSKARVSYAIQTLSPSGKEPISDWETISEKTVTHKGTWTTHTHNLQGGWLMPGPKAIRVEVEDLNSGQIAQKNVAFRVAW